MYSDACFYISKGILEWQLPYGLMELGEDKCVPHDNLITAVSGIQYVNSQFNFLVMTNIQISN